MGTFFQSCLSCCKKSEKVKKIKLKFDNTFQYASGDNEEINHNALFKSQFEETLEKYDYSDFKGKEGIANQKLIFKALKKTMASVFQAAIYVSDQKVTEAPVGINPLKDIFDNEKYTTQVKS